MSKNILSKKIKDLRLAKGWTQEELAQKLNTPVAKVKSWEIGRTKNIISFINFERVCNLFEVDMNKVLVASGIYLASGGLPTTRKRTVRKPAVKKVAVKQKPIVKKVVVKPKPVVIKKVTEELPLTKTIRVSAVTTTTVASQRLTKNVKVVQPKKVIKTEVKEEVIVKKQNIPANNEERKVTVISNVFARFVLFLILGIPIMVGVGLSLFITGLSLILASPISFFGMAVLSGISQGLALQGELVYFLRTTLFFFAGPTASLILLAVGMALVFLAMFVWKHSGLFFFNKQMSKTSFYKAINDFLKSSLHLIQSKITIVLIILSLILSSAIAIWITVLAIADPTIWGMFNLIFVPAP